VSALEDRDRPFLAAYPFATLVTPALQVATAPLRVAGDGLLEGHLARATGRRLGLSVGPPRTRRRGPRHADRRPGRRS